MGVSIHYPEHQGQPNARTISSNPLQALPNQRIAKTLLSCRYAQLFRPTLYARIDIGAAAIQEKLDKPSGQGRQIDLATPASARLLEERHELLSSKSRRRKNAVLEIERCIGVRLQQMRQRLKVFNYPLTKPVSLCTESALPVRTASAHHQGKSLPVGEYREPNWSIRPGPSNY